MSDKVENKGKRVLCACCKKPIHISKFAGITRNPDGTASFWCDDTFCTMEMSAALIDKRTAVLLNKENE